MTWWENPIHSDKTRGEFYINHEVVVGSSFPNKTRTLSYLSDEYGAILCSGSKTKENQIIIT